MTARLDEEEIEKRKLLFGKFREGFKSVKPYWHDFPEGKILEIPVTTMPVFKAPFHVSYLLYLRRFSRRLALSYFHFALAMCRATGTQPSLLLHPLDFLGSDDGIGLDFFPAMQMPSTLKTNFVSEIIEIFRARYDVGPMKTHAQNYNVSHCVPVEQPETASP